MIRSTALAAVTAFLFVSAAIGISRADEGKGGKCTIAVKGDSPTAKACAKGGRDEA